MASCRSEQQPLHKGSFAAPKEAILEEPCMFTSLPDELVALVAKIVANDVCWISKQSGRLSRGAFIASSADCRATVANFAAASKACHSAAEVWLLRERTIRDSKLYIEREVRARELHARAESFARLSRWGKLKHKIFCVHLSIQ